MGCQPIKRHNHTHCGQFENVSQPTTHVFLDRGRKPLKHVENMQCAVIEPPTPEVRATMPPYYYCCCYCFFGDDDDEKEEEEDEDDDKEED